MLIFCLFFLVLSLYAVFSYILTEPNLVLSSHPLYFNFQMWMWDRFYSESNFITASYVILIFAMFFCYLWLFSLLKKQKTEFKLSLNNKFAWFYSVLLVPLFLSYNALSHDIFNYLFNARMVLKWGYNPHVKTALDFIQIDDWVRFMHNIHTTAPYGYGWTALSLIPSFIGMEKLLPTLIMFRVFMILGIILLYFCIQHLSQTLNKRNLYLHELALVFLNPLFLLEVVSNYHNDLWMMAPAVLSVSMLLRSIQPEKLRLKMPKKIIYFLILLLLFLVSISVKIVTVLLSPFFIFGFVVIFFLNSYSGLIKSRFNLHVPAKIIAVGLLFITNILQKYVPTMIAIILFIPLFMARSQQFLPWYMLWILVWVPFIQNKTLRNVVLVFTFSSLLRYMPWLNNSFEYSDEIIFQQKIVTWIPPIVYLFTNIKHAPTKIKQLSRI